MWKWLVGGAVAVGGYLYLTRVHGANGQAPLTFDVNAPTGAFLSAKVGDVLDLRNLPTPRVVIAPPSAWQGRPGTNVFDAVGVGGSIAVQWTTPDGQTHGVASVIGS